MAKQQVLLIGGTGFIGSAIVERLLQSEEFEVHLMIRPSSRGKENRRQELAQTHLYTDVSEASLKQLFTQLDPNICIINLVVYYMLAKHSHMARSLKRRTLILCEPLLQLCGRIACNDIFT